MGNGQWLMGGRRSADGCERRRFGRPGCAVGPRSGIGVKDRRTTGLEVRATAENRLASFWGCFRPNPEIGGGKGPKK